MKLFWYLAAFFLFVILLLWIFQVVFMGGFYRTVTVNRLKKSAVQITSAALNGGDVGAAAYDAAERSGVCISVYCIKDGSGTQIAEAHVKNGCFIHTFISNADLNRIYSETGVSGGSLVTELLGNNSADGSSILYSYLSGGKDRAEYLILFNTEAFPVGAMSSTITVQLTLITTILLIGAGALAVVLSRKITRPVSGLCSEAEKLAGGVYDIGMPEGNILEINQLGEALIYAASELEKSDRMQKELIANVTHDLRTPLTMISGYSEVMRDIPGEMSAENMQVIIDESARLSALVNDVLELSKAQRGTMELNPKRFCITEAIREETRRYGEMLKVHGYNVEYESDGISAITEGDETKLMQAFCNLLNNAVNFTGDDKHVIVRQTVRDGVCRTEVIDSGAGIAVGELENIWGRYYRARDFQKKGIPGTGLGLSIVKQIMLAHGASFGVASTPGKGSMFWFEVKVCS